MSYIKQDEGGGGDTYTLKAAQSGADVDIQLDAAAGADSDVKLKAGTNITLTEASDTVTIDSAGAGGSIGVNQVAFGDPLNAGDIKGSDNFTFVDESGAVGADVKISGDRPTFTLEDDTGATDYKSIFRQSGSSGYWVHADSTGVDRQMIRVASRDIIINESGDDVDVRIEGDTVDNLFRTAATQDNIGIGGQPGANVQRLHVVGDSNNTSTTDAVVKIQNTLSGQTFTALELSNENDDANSDVTMRMRSNSGTDSDFEIVHDSFGGTTFLTNQPNTGTTAQMKISAGDVNVNPGSADVDMIVSSQGNSNLIRTDAANDEVGIGVVPTSGSGVLQVDGNTKIGTLTIEEDSQAQLHVVGTTASLCVERHDDGSAAGPSLTLYRHSDSPADNDEVGQISFRGEDDTNNNATYASIKTVIKDVSAGSKDGELTIRTLTANSQTNAIIIDDKVNSEITHNFKGEIQLNDQAGTAGQVLTSQGSGADPIWAAGGGSSAPDSGLGGDGYIRNCDIASNISSTSVYGVNNLSSGETQSTTWGAALNPATIVFFPLVMPKTGTLSKLGFRTQSSVGGSTTAFGLYRAGSDMKPTGSAIFSTSLTLSTFTSFDFTMSPSVTAGEVIWLAWFGYSSSLPQLSAISGINLPSLPLLDSDGNNIYIAKIRNTFSVSGNTFGVFPTINAAYFNNVFTSQQQTTVPRMGIIIS